ncbi:MAG: hypothetical protein ACRD1Z_22750 [Vicinamibacteria bacterium]
MTADSELASATIASATCQSGACEPIIRRIADRSRGPRPHSADLYRELADIELTRALQPGCLGREIGDRTEEPHLAPRDFPAREGTSHERQSSQSRRNERKALELAPRDAKSFPGVVADAGKAEAMVSAEGKEPRRCPPELTTGPRLKMRKADDAPIDARRRIA